MGLQLSYTVHFHFSYNLCKLPLFVLYICNNNIKKKKYTLRAGCFVKDFYVVCFKIPLSLSHDNKTNFTETRSRSDF